MLDSRALINADSSPVYMHSCHTFAGQLQCYSSWPTSAHLQQLKLPTCLSTYVVVMLLMQSESGQFEHHKEVN